MRKTEDYEAARATMPSPRSFAVVVAVSSIMSSRPPIVFWRRSSTGVSRGGAPKRGALGMESEGRVDAGEAQRRRRSVDAEDVIFGGVHRLEAAGAGDDAHPVARVHRSSPDGRRSLRAGAMPRRRS